MKNMQSQEMIYLQKNKDKLERKYEGKCIAIHKKKVVAVGRTIAEVYSQVKNLKVKNPLVTYIPKKSEEALLI